MRYLSLALCLVAPMTLAVAKAAEPPPKDAAATAPCRAAPDDGTASPKSDKEQSSAQDKTDQTALSDKLADCNGVLKPPATGDGEIVTPPPAGGVMPVIPPSQVPPQQTPK